MLTRDQIALFFLYEIGVFDSVAEVKANPEHRSVVAAYRAADKILAATIKTGIHEAAIDPFERLLQMMEPLNLPHDRPLADVIPGVWPTWGEFKNFMEAVKAS